MSSDSSRKPPAFPSREKIACPLFLHPRFRGSHELRKTRAILGPVGSDDWRSTLGARAADVARQVVGAFPARVDADSAVGPCPKIPADGSDGCSQNGGHNEVSPDEVDPPGYGPCSDHDQHRQRCAHERAHAVATMPSNSHEQVRWRQQHRTLECAQIPPVGRKRPIRPTPDGPEAPQNKESRLNHGHSGPSKSGYVSIVGRTGRRRSPGNTSAIRLVTIFDRRQRVSGLPVGEAKLVLGEPVLDLFERRSLL